MCIKIIPSHTDIEIPSEDSARCIKTPFFPGYIYEC